MASFCKRTINPMWINELVPSAVVILSPLNLNESVVHDNVPKPQSRLQAAKIFVGGRKDGASHFNIWRKRRKVVEDHQCWIAVGIRFDRSTSKLGSSSWEVAFEKVGSRDVTFKESPQQRRQIFTRDGEASASRPCLSL